MRDTINPALAYPSRIWLYTPSKGWGYTFRVPCIIVGAGRARVKIAALTEKCVLKTRFVSDENLTLPLPLTEMAKCDSVRTHWLEAAESRGAR
jgi:hypothetical protein